MEVKKASIRGRQKREKENKEGKGEKKQCPPTKKTGSGTYNYASQATHGLQRHLFAYSSNKNIWLSCNVDSRATTSTHSSEGGVFQKHPPLTVSPWNLSSKPTPRWHPPCCCSTLHHSASLGARTAPGDTPYPAHSGGTALQWRGDGIPSTWFSASPRLTLKTPRQ